MSISQSRLKSVFSDIIKGHSLAEYKSKKVYIKHLNNLDAANIDEIYQTSYGEAIKNQLPTLENREKEIIEQEIWTKENELKEQLAFLDGLILTKKQLFRELEIKAIQSQIDLAQNKINKLRVNKNELIGITAESFAGKRANEHHVFHCFYSKPFTERFFSTEEFDYIDNITLFELINLYANSLLDFSLDNIKKVALLSSFMNFFYLCDDNPLVFYGKPIIELTFYQVELFGHGKYFKHILSNAKTSPPFDVMQDPDKLIEWYDSTNNVDKLMGEKDENTISQTVVGTTSNDRKKFGMDSNQGVDLIEEAKKRGGKLSMADIAKLQEL